MIDIKNYIENKLYTKDGRINSAILRRDWFLQSEEYNVILEKTAFLPNDARLTHRIYCVLNDMTCEPICPICNVNKRVFLPHKSVGYSDTCNNKGCISKNPNNNQARIKTCLEKYGTKVSPLTIRKFKERINDMYKKGRNTMLERYGVSSPSQIPEIKIKISQNNKVRFTSSKFIKKIEEKRIEKIQDLPDIRVINIINPSDNKIEKYETAVYYVEYECLKCGNIDKLANNTIFWRHRNLNSTCTVCSGIKNGSYLQSNLFNWLKQHVEDLEINNKTLLNDQRLEVDLFSPSLNLAVEIDGLFWHSYNYKETKAEKYKHKNKTLLLKEKGVKLVHIFENELKYKEAIVKSRLLALSGKANKLHARKCNIKKLTQKEEREFFNKTHIQGYVKSKHAYGLFLEDTLLAAMSFGNSRYDKNVEYELLRYSSELNTQVIGGASKLFRHFVNTYNPNTILSYCDLRWGDGKVYEKMGFSFVEETPLNYYYVKSENLYSRIKFQKHKLKNLLQNFDESLPEYENMFNNGYRRIWDCGNSKWLWKKEGA